MTNKPEFEWHGNPALAETILIELRNLWAEFDPIDIMHMREDGWKVEDEYDSYFEGTLDCLKSDSPQASLLNYITRVVTEQMEEDLGAEALEVFVSKLLDWFKTVEARTLQANT